MLRHKERCERDVGRNGNVARYGVLSDVEISDVRPAGDTNRREVLIARRQLDSLIRDEDRLQMQPLRSTEAYLLHLARCRVSIQPEPQRFILQSRVCVPA